jgi:hypothetical protein
MKNKLLIIASHLSTGGAPQFTLNKIELLKETYDVYCVEYDFLSPHFVVQRNKIINLLGDKFYSLSSNKWELMDIIDSIHPDIISIEEISETFIQSDILEKIYTPNRRWKIIETTHNSHDNSNLKRYLPDKFTFVSPCSLDMYKHLGVESTLIEYPIDKKERNKKEAQLKLGLDPNSIHILNVGLFTQGKNQGYAFKIAEKLKDKNFVFHFVGNLAGNFQEYWSPILETKPDNCVIWGEKDNVNEFIEACDLFLFTSIFELNPLVIKEVLCYNIPIFMFNLHTYYKGYDTNTNCSFLSGSLENDSNMILEHFNYKRQSKGYVLYSNKKYLDISKKCIESIRSFSRLPIYLYLLDFYEEIDIPNVHTINWKCDLETDESMYQLSNNNLYINRSNKNIYKLLIQRPRIIKDAIEKFIDVAAYIDSDSISTSYVDNIFNMYPEDSEYPYFVEGVYDYLFYNGRGGAETKEDLTSTLEHPSCELFDVNQKIRERYRQTGYFVAGKNTIDFLEEWSSMCENPTVMDNNEWFAPYNEETIANVLLWKKGILNGLPSIYVNGNSEIIDKVYDEVGFTGHDNLLDNWLRIPAKEENLLFFHGEKNIENLNKMIEKLKTKNDIRRN